MAAQGKKVELNKELKDAGFKLVGKPVSNKFIHPKFGEIDFKKLTVKQAERMVANKFPYLSKSKKE